MEKFNRLLMELSLEKTGGRRNRKRRAMYLGAAAAGGGLGGGGAADLITRILRRRYGKQFEKFRREKLGPKLDDWVRSATEGLAKAKEPFPEGLGDYVEKLVEIGEEVGESPALRKLERLQAMRRGIIAMGAGAGATLSPLVLWAILRHRRKQKRR